MKVKNFHYLLLIQYIYNIYQLNLLEPSIKKAISFLDDVYEHYPNLKPKEPIFIPYEEKKEEDNYELTLPDINESSSPGIDSQESVKQEEDLNKEDNEILFDLPNITTLKELIDKYNELNMKINEGETLINYNKEYEEWSSNYSEYFDENNTVININDYSMEDSSNIYLNFLRKCGNIKITQLKKSTNYETINNLYEESSNIYVDIKTEKENIKNALTFCIIILIIR